ncbi:glycosyltransferase family 4 protein [Geminocystis sp. GBBB08]|uniref:glycosyltransferase family 4 protein n=1 Tax=Geminocystis sp. GBBB08 TaxID=2604140 RepID=UPI0027E3515E|nr:glycosyltransferase family 4 protein [Geminocystis sp. GBBB08]MBL1211119.1 glycosyltransferase family 4 protein [Geminocystis sp. GBBB08]
MKILLINDYATPTGGAAISILTLRDLLRQKGHDVRLFSSSVRISGQKPLADYYCFGTTSRFRTLLQTVNIFAWFRLRQVLKEFKPDIVHVVLFLTQLSPLILPLLKNIPCLLQVVWYRSICPLGTKRLPDNSICQVKAGKPCYVNSCLPLRDFLPLMLQMNLLRSWYFVFDLIVANSDYVKTAFEKENIKVSSVIYHGFPKQETRSNLSSIPLVGFAGRLVSEKGVDLLIKAFSDVVKVIPNAQLIIAGSGSEDKNLKNLIKELNLNSSVEMLGYIPQKKLGSTFNQVWVQVVPSLWAEPFGMVATEAMLREIPVIASKIGGLQEIVQDGITGILIPVGDRKALSSALIKLLSNVDLIEQMGKAAQKVALTKFTEEIMVEKFSQIYQKLLKNEIRN